MNPLLDFHRLQTRRQFFGDTGLRAGSIALASMLGHEMASASQLQAPLPGLPHFAP